MVFFEHGVYSKPVVDHHGFRNGHERQVEHLSWMLAGQNGTL